MIIKNKVITAQARDALRGRWKQAILIFIIYIAIYMSFAILLNSLTNYNSGFRKYEFMDSNNIDFKKNLMFNWNLERNDFDNDIFDNERNWSGIMNIHNPMYNINSYCNLFVNIFTVLMHGPLFMGLVVFFLAFTRNKRTNEALFFDGFRTKNLTRSLIANFAISLVVILYTILLIIPGIIKALSYTLTFYIMADNQNISPLEAMKKSTWMMRGHKAQLFLLGFRFIGWFILCILTMGIGFIFLFPYILTSITKFYESVREESYQDQSKINEDIEIIK